MTAAPIPPNPGELIDKFISQLPDKIKLWRFVGKMAVEQVNKRLVDQVDNYSSREPSNPPVMPKPAKPNTNTNTKKKTAAQSKVKKTSTSTSISTSTKLPIAGYDDLSALQILDLLGALNKTELAKIKKYETAHRSRQTILKKIATLSDASK